MMNDEMKTAAAESAVIVASVKAGLCFNHPMSKAYKNGRKAAREWVRRGTWTRKPVCPYNGPELCDDWQAGFDSIVGGGQ